MGKKFENIWNKITSVIVVLFLVLALALVGVKLIGLQVFTVLSGSMEPTYKTGSLIYVKQVNYLDLLEGDVITFMLNEDTIATHRIMEVIPDEENQLELRFKTKGDANNTVDGGVVHHKNIIGSPIFTLPKLGYLANFIQNPPGRYLAISAGSLLILAVFLPDLLKEVRKEGKDHDINKK